MEEISEEISDRIDGRLIQIGNTVIVVIIAAGGCSKVRHMLEYIYRQRYAQVIV